MATIVFNSGLDLLNDFETADFQCALLTTSASISASDEVLSDVIVDEITTLGLDYFRYTLTGKTRTVDNFLNRITYDCDDLFFGAPAAGQDIGYIILFKNSGFDSTSPMVLSLDLGPGGVPTTGLGLSFAVGATGLVYTDQGA